VSADRVAVVGGGLTGLTLAYRLTAAGIGVDLFEASPGLGGLAGDMELDGQRVDRFYHVILPTDERVIGLAREVGLDADLRFVPTGVGFFHDGRMESISTISEFLRFSLLSPPQRLRLGAFVAYCQRISGWEKIDHKPLVEWVTRLAGRGVYERMWKPLLEAKFDGRVGDLSATWLWSRTRRMSGARRNGSQEVCGALAGGYQTLCDRLAERIRAQGGTVNTSTPIDSIEPGETPVVTVGGEARPYRMAAITVLPPVARRLVGDADGAALRGTPERYLGIVCVLLKTRRSMSPYYTINIADPEVGLTGIVETTRVIDPDGERDHALVYLPKYVDSTNPILDAPDEEILERFLAGFRRIFPDFDPATELIAHRVMRARLAEPVHGIGAGAGVPGTFDDAFPGIAFASTAQIFPTVVSGQATIGLAERALPDILERLAPASPEAERELAPMGA
jgi:protoporphyrinogen oxidase